MAIASNKNGKAASVWLTVLVCGLGYFVDIYDLILFSIVRPTSLKAIGLVTEDQILDASEYILNAQMIGMLIGGIIFGILADKRGRLSVLLGSILMYSLMNIVNAFVTTVDMYAMCRFFSGIGLAGELGVAITLVAEVMPTETRGVGTTLVASLGVLGAVGAYLVHEMTDWRVAFVIGGVLGLALLALRVGIRESTMFHALNEKTAVRGNFFMLLKPERLPRYISSILIGLPVWFVIGILVTFSSPRTGAKDRNFHCRPCSRNQKPARTTRLRLRPDPARSSLKRKPLAAAARASAGELHRSRGRPGE